MMRSSRPLVCTTALLLGVFVVACGSDRKRTFGTSGEAGVSGAGDFGGASNGSVGGDANGSGDAHSGGRDGEGGAEQGGRNTGGRSSGGSTSAGASNGGKSSVSAGGAHEGGSASGGGSPETGGASAGGSASAGARAGGVSGGPAATGGSDMGGQAGAPGGTGGAIEPESLLIVTTDLPPARFNIDYEALLEATGRGPSELTWTLSDGALPGGLELTTTGRLLGRPSARGTFPIQVTVTADDGTDASASYELVVERHSMLAYIMGGENTDTYDAYLRARPNTVNIKVSPDFKPDPNYPDEKRYCHTLSFSPDGSWLAFVADQRASYSWSLFAVSLANDEVGPTMGLSNPESQVLANWVNDSAGLQHIVGLSWAPSGHRLAFHADDNESGDSSIYVVDLDTADPQPMLVGTIDGSHYTDMAWLSDTQLLALVTNGGLYRIDWSNSIPGSVTQMTTIVEFFPAMLYLADDRSRLLAMDGTSGGPPRAEIRPMAAGDSWAGNVPYVFNRTPDLRRILAGGSVLDLTNLAAPTALFDIPSGGYGVMSPEGNSVAWPNTETSELSLTDLSGASPTTHAVSTETDVSQVIFSPNGSLIAYDPDGGKVKVAPVEPGADVTTVSDGVLDTSYWLTLLSFAPNSEWLTFSAPKSRAEKPDLYLVDVRDPAADSWEYISAALPADHFVNGQWVRWAPDSSAVGFLTRSSSIEAFLYVSDLLGNDREAFDVGTCTWCEVRDFQFQP